MFRFTIRDVLWLTVVVGLVAGWWADHWRLVRYGQAWQTVATLLYGDVQQATGESPQWGILGRPWPEKSN